MTFLNFGALFGLAAIGIPIAIHLLNKMQVREMPWAAMRFLLESIEKNQRRLQIEDLILLLLRCLLVALLILALSRPNWESGRSQSGSHVATAVMILDNSYSMGLTNGIQTRLEQAQAAAEKIIQAFPQGSSSALFFASNNVQPAIPEPTYDFNLLRKTVRDAKLTDRATDLSMALQLAVETLQKHGGGGSKEIYLITDGQANGWGQLDQLSKQMAEIQKQISVHVILVGDQSESNLGVTGLRLDNGLAPVNQPLRCSVEVSNGSQSEVRDVRVSLQVDDEPSIDEKIIDRIPARTSHSVSLFAKIRSDGYHTITAKIPSDRLPADDHRTVALHAIHKVKVLLIQGTSSSVRSQSDDFFVRNALVPLAPAEVDSYYIKTSSITASQLGGVSLDDYDAVFLLGVDSLALTQVQAFMDYVRQGGGLAIFPGPRCDLDFYNGQLGRGNFLPARLGITKGDPNQHDKPFILQSKDYDHPISALWNDPLAGTLVSSHFYAYYPLTPAPWKAPAKGETNPPDGQPRVVLHFEGGDPAVVEHTWGLGRVVLFSSSATLAWNDLPIHPAFVPLMNRVLGSLVERQEEGLNIAVGQKFSYAVSSDQLNKDVSVRAPGSQSLPRIVGKVALVNGSPTVQYDEADKAGAYCVTIGRAPGTTLYFAAQADPAESNLTPLSSDQLKELGSVAEVVKWSPETSFSAHLAAARIGRELWFPLLIVALVLAALETFLAQRFSQSR